MSFLLCGSDGGPGKENVHAQMRKPATTQCFGLRAVSNQQPKPMESFTLVIERGAAGFGFSVTGSKPAKIKAVKEGSTAQIAGLRKDDHVIRINGENVAHFLAENIAKLVRQCESEIVLDIEREGKRQTVVDNYTTQPTSKIQHTLWTSEDSLQMSRDQLYDLRINFEELSEPEQDRQAAINKLCQCEKDFLAQMHFGIQRYCGPLRHSLISPAEHSTLFQNVEKLVALSEYHVHKLEDEAREYLNVRDQHDTFFDTIGSVYVPKVLVMSELFEQYCNGIKDSFRLLAELRVFEEFEAFLQASSPMTGMPSISGFIQKPLEHIKNLVLNLQSVLSLTPLEHQDTDSLSQVVETLKGACNRVNDNNTRRCMSMTSLVSRSCSGSRSSSKSSRSSSNSSTSSASSSRSSANCSMSSADCSMSSVNNSGSSMSLNSSSSRDQSFASSSGSRSSIESSLDPEVLDIQRRLVFNDEVPALQLATATRHLIYAGEVQHVDGDQLYVVLMSDLVLLTKLEPDDRLLVVDHPLLLRDIVSVDFADSDSLDFCLTIESSIDEEWVEDCDIVLTAPSVELKYTWKHLLEQRIKSSQTQWDFLKEDSFI